MTGDLSPLSPEELHEIHAETSALMCEKGLSHREAMAWIIARDGTPWDVGRKRMEGIIGRPLDMGTYSGYVGRARRKLGLSDARYARNKSLKTQQTKQ